MNIRQISPLIRRQIGKNKYRIAKSKKEVSGMEMWRALLSYRKLWEKMPEKIIAFFHGMIIIP